MKKNIFILNFDAMFIQQPLEAGANLAAIQANLRNAFKLRGLLNALAAQNHHICLFSFYSPEHWVSVKEYLEELFSVAGNFIGSNDIYYLEKNQNPLDLVFKLTADFNRDNPEETISDNELERIIFVDIDEGKTVEARMKGFLSISINKTNRYLIELEKTIGDSLSDQERLLNNYIANRESFWGRHKGKITVAGTLLSGIVGAVVVSTGDLMTLATGMQALVGFVIGMVPTGSILSGAYVYSTCCVKPLVLNLQNKNDGDVEEYRCNLSLDKVRTRSGSMEESPLLTQTQGRNDIAFLEVLRRKYGSVTVTADEIDSASPIITIDGGPARCTNPPTKS